MTTHQVSIVLWQTLAIFLFICALIGIAVSLLLIFNPHLMERINRVVSRWITTRHISQFLDRSVNIEQWFYRYHRPFGIFIVLGACYILAYFGLLLDKTAALQYLKRYAPHVHIDIFLDALVLIALVCAVIAFLVGLFLWLRPSMLRGIEEDTNQWISSRRALKPLEVPRDNVERFVTEHAQRIGWLLLLGSICLLIALLRVLV